MQRSALAEGPEGSRSEVLDLIHEHCEGGNLATALQSSFFLAPDRRLHNNNVMQVVWGDECWIELPSLQGCCSWYAL